MDTKMRTNHWSSEEGEAVAEKGKRIKNSQKLLQIRHCKVRKLRNERNEAQRCRWRKEKKNHWANNVGRLQIKHNGGSYKTFQSPKEPTIPKHRTEGTKAARRCLLEEMTQQKHWKTIHNRGKGGNKHHRPVADTTEKKMYIQRWDNTTASSLQSVIEGTSHHELVLLDSLKTFFFFPVNC